MGVNSPHRKETRPESKRANRPCLKNLNFEVARAILALRLDENDENLMHQFSVKNQGAGLLAEESRDLESLLNITMFVNLMRAKALLSLKNAGQLDDTVLKGE